MYSDSTLEAIRSQLDRAKEFTLYQEHLGEASTSTIESWEDFREVPFLEEDDLHDDFDQHGPEGSLYDGAAMLSFTPLGEDLAPVFDTRRDLEYQAEVNAQAFQRAGIEAGDRVLNTFGYHTFGTGIIIHRGLEELGAEVIPAGPGDSEQVAATIETFDVDGLVGNPSFALKIAEAGGSVDRFVAAGEPFTSVPGYRQQVKDALGAVTACDYFGTRQILPVAAETVEESGLVVLDDYAIVEIIDPDTDEVLGSGERGEVVVTHVHKEAVPLIRYRTGDLAELDQRGESIVMPDGVIGRTDERLKVKGVKIYPESLGTVLAAFDGLSGEYRIEVTQPATTDHMTLIVEGEVDIDQLRSAVTTRLLIEPDEIRAVDELSEPGVVDDRYE